MTADYLIGIGTVFAGLAAVASVVVTIQGNRRVQKVQSHLKRQDRALGLDTNPDPDDPNGA